MNLSYFLAKRLYTAKAGNNNASNSASFIASLGVFVGLTVLIISFSMIIGFKRVIHEKVRGFNSDIRITKAIDGFQNDEAPITYDSILSSSLKDIKEVNSCSPFISIPAIIKTDNDFTNIILEGKGADYDTDFLNKHLKEGKLPNFKASSPTNEILISSVIAKQLNLKLGEKIYLYFMRKGINVRRLTIVGIYETNLYSYDMVMAFTDICMLRKLMKWKTDEVSGVSITLNDSKQTQEVTLSIGDMLNKRYKDEENNLMARSLKDSNSFLFSWLDILDINMWFIVAIMLFVTGFTITAGLLILIIERTPSICILKSYGADNKLIKKIFLYMGGLVIVKAMAWANLFSFAIILIQNLTHILKLNPEIYYMNHIPMAFDIVVFGFINLLTIVISIVILTLPTLIIKYISPKDILSKTE